MASTSFAKDLEACGIAGSNTLREKLATCNDPVEAIKQFQEENSIQVNERDFKSNRGKV